MSDLVSSTGEPLAVDEAQVQDKMERMMLRLGMVKDPVTGEWGPSAETLAEAAAEAGITPELEEQAAQQQQAQPEAQPDWSKYELDPQFAHLYPKSRIEGNQIIAPWVQLNCFTAAFSKAGEAVEQLVNGPEQWQIAAIVPNGSGMIGFVLQRTVRFALPNPAMIQTDVDVPEPTDPELAATEAAALAWAGQEEPTTEGAVEGANIEEILSNG